MGSKAIRIPGETGFELHEHLMITFIYEVLNPC